jgi:hypothetical protein
MYSCNLCDYNSSSRTGFCNHKKTKKHIKNTIKFENNETKKIENDIIFSRDKEIQLLNDKIKSLESERDSLSKYVDLLTKNDNIKKKIKKYKSKEIIPATVKNTLWRKYFNENITGKCCCCKVENISIKNFDCGHVISEKNGGIVKLDNLKPVCRLCNSSMSTMNMDEFIKKYGFDNIK